jgi:hypothetical protein
MAACVALYIQDFLFHTADLDQYSPGAGHYRAPVLRQYGALVRALDHGHAEFLFKSPYALGQSGLADGKFLGGFPDAAHVGNRDELFKLFEPHE